MGIKKIEKLDELIELEKKGELEGLFKVSDEIYFDKKCPGVTRSMLNDFAKSAGYYYINIFEEF